MKKYYWVGLLFFAQIAYAGLFEDEEARKQLNSIQDQLNNIQANIQSNVDAKVTQALKNRNVNRTAINNQNDYWLLNTFKLLLTPTTLKSAVRLDLLITR
jgi:hypothetical protein